MKTLSVPTVLAVMIALSNPAGANEVGKWQERVFLTPADRVVDGEIDHNADASGAMGDSSSTMPADDSTPPTEAPPVSKLAPKPLVKSPMAKKDDSATDVPAPKHAKAQKVPARDITLIETENAGESSPDITYVTGGIGEDEKASIEAAKADYNLHVMSASINGAFVGDARVVISSKNGTETKELLNVVAGPLLYVKLPDGKYALDATLGDQKKHQDFTIGGKTTNAKVHLGWKVAATRSDEQ